jgi:chorismate mutase
MFTCQILDSKLRIDVLTFDTDDPNSRSSNNNKANSNDTCILRGLNDRQAGSGRVGRTKQALNWKRLRTWAREEEVWR